METKLIDYTKFRLKPVEELRECIENVNNLYVFSCSKCYRRFEQNVQNEFEELRRILGEQENRISDHRQIDFLCNNFLTGNLIEGIDLSDYDAVGVISCGIGIQYIAGLLNHKRVIALADSVPQSGNSTCGMAYHGISLEQEQCAACDQCFLNRTCGICPIVECAKGLVNGPCGGAHDGKCEVDPEMDCAWVKIYERMKKRAAVPDLEEVQVRDFSKPSSKLTNSLLEMNRFERDHGFYGGLHPLECKGQTDSLAIRSFPEPEKMIIFVSQHTGRKAIPLVNVGDHVYKGQKIAESDGTVSANIHSSISGKVIAIEDHLHPTLQRGETAVVIENDMSNTMHPSIEKRADHHGLSAEELLDIIKESGVVGLGGAMFPTQVKLKPPKKVDTLLVNGCECEPFLNSDNRIIIEHAEELCVGIDILKKVLDVGKVIIGIEDNKPEAMTVLKSINHDPGIDLVQLNTKYPQGAEKMLIKRLLGRQVPRGGLPFDVGVIVSNIGTILAIYRAVVEGIPLFERIVTISGEQAIRPGNYRVKIGTPLQDILDYCFSLENNSLEDQYELKMGGPMMGIVQKSPDTAVIKGTSGITLFKSAVVTPSDANYCIKCGRCVSVCPMELYPLQYAYYNQAVDMEGIQDYNVMDCIECRSCEYICSAKLPLLSFIKKGKIYACSTT